jgi:hypothetical protein
MILPDCFRSGQQILNSVQQRPKSAWRQQSRENQSCDGAGKVCLMTDVPGPAAHQMWSLTSPGIMELHHGKHHASYVENANVLPRLSGLSTFAPR